MNPLSPELLASYWSANEIATNIVVFMNLVGALALGLVLGYERSYHGRAAGMRTYGLVCVASCAVTVIAATPARGMAARRCCTMQGPPSRCPIRPGSSRASSPGSVFSAPA